MTKWCGIDYAENMTTEAFETLHCVNMTQHNKLIAEKAPNFKHYGRMYICAVGHHLLQHI